MCGMGTFAFASAAAGAASAWGGGGGGGHLFLVINRRLDESYVLEGTLAISVAAFTAYGCGASSTAWKNAAIVTEGGRRGGGVVASFMNKNKQTNYASHKNTQKMEVPFFTLVGILEGGRGHELKEEAQRVNAVRAVLEVLLYWFGVETIQRRRALHGR
ncbi:hypothetical protein T492DRAFT_833685 [Pavlovales sp. CCMP2436]|nr:hypothetical protein T492DRAFT_833685 [Pavlovales sp. CCMP2436]